MVTQHIHLFQEKTFLEAPRWLHSRNPIAGETIIQTYSSEAHKFVTFVPVWPYWLGWSFVICFWRNGLQAPHEGLCQHNMTVHRRRNKLEVCLINNYYDFTWHLFSLSCDYQWSQPMGVLHEKKHVNISAVSEKPWWKKCSLISWNGKEIAGSPEASDSAHRCKSIQP